MAVPDANLIQQVQTIQTNLINLYRTLQALSPSAATNMLSTANAYVSMDQMLASMIISGTT